MPVKNLSQIKQRFASIAKVTEGNKASSSGKMSFTVIYNHNGKRITISKKLAEALKLTDTAQISFSFEDGVVLLAKVTSEDPDQRIVLELKDEKDTVKDGVTGKKIAYTADTAYAIVTGFKLDYAKKSSMSFDKIEIDSSDPENPIAIITIKAVG